MIKKILLTILLTTLSTVTYAGINPESYYQEFDCQRRNGIKEYVLDNKKRVDCLTKRYAIEHDFAIKWTECFSQALYYAMKTDRKAMCVLIVESDKDLKHVTYAEQTKKFYKLPLKINLIFN